jgi:hypothetical protein
MVESRWNVVAHGDAREGKWRGNWLMEWIASTLNTTSEHGVSSITTADAHTSAASSRLNWRPCRFKWTHPFRRKTKSGFFACVITFQKQSNVIIWSLNNIIRSGQAIVGTCIWDVSAWNFNWDIDFPARRVLCFLHSLVENAWLVDDSARSPSVQLFWIIQAQSSQQLTPYKSKLRF